MKLIFKTVGWHAVGIEGGRSYGVEGDEENGFSAMVWANKRSSKSEQLDGGPFKTFALAVDRCQEDEDARA